MTLAVPLNYYQHQIAVLIDFQGVSIYNTFGKFDITKILNISSKNINFTIIYLQSCSEKAKTYHK